jgi:hypothetical protein
VGAIFFPFPTPNALNATIIFQLEVMKAAKIFIFTSLFLL